MKRELYFGEIKFYNRQKMYGFITEHGTGTEYFFMKKDAAIRDERLISYLPVSFSTIAENEKSFMYGWSGTLSGKKKFQ